MEWLLVVLVEAVVEAVIGVVVVNAITRKRES
jgi:hypothetical protein